MTKNLLLRGASFLLGLFITTAAQAAIPPTNAFESAIVATLPANAASYTFVVRGVNNTIGIAVVEVYALP